MKYYLMPALMSLTDLPVCFKNLKCKHGFTFIAVIMLKKRQFYWFLVCIDFKMCDACPYVAFK